MSKMKEQKNGLKLNQSFTKQLSRYMSVHVTLLSFNFNMLLNVIDT